MNRQTKDLFDDSSMSFGEHLEALRVHLIRAILGLTVAVIISLFWGGLVVDFVRQPIDTALRKYSTADIEDDTKSVKTFSDKMYDEWGLDIIFGERKKADTEPTDPEEIAAAQEKLPRGTIRVTMPVRNLQAALHKVDPELVPAPTAGPPAVTSATNPVPVTPPSSTGNDKVEDKSTATPIVPPEPTVSLLISSPELAEMQAVVEQSRRAVTLKVEEAFMTYLQVATISGFLLASPWIFYQLWLFVGAGLYPHERRYVHIYGLLSLVLFLSGAAFCFYAVFPFVLKFLLSFNSFLEIQPQIRLSEWINFAIMLPVMFGISFQLPLVMLFLERLQIIEANTYTKNRKMAILIISIASMFLTPADPMSMILMMLPLVLLYELGILLCRWAPSRSPFEAGTAT